jgi:phage shock protein C
MKKIYLSKHNKKLAGVCGGIAEAYNLDATVVRLIAILLAMVTHIAPTLFVYIVLALILPRDPHHSEFHSHGEHHG